MILRKDFNIDKRLKIFLKELEGCKLSSLYAPQGVFWKNSNEDMNLYLGEKVIITFYSSNFALILNQYKVSDQIFLSKTSNINFDIKDSRLIELEPELLSKGFYYDFSGDEIIKIEIFAYHSMQAAEDEWAEISIADASGKTHYFIDIKCSYILRFLTKKSNLNLMLDNERYFQGGHEDFTSRFRILDDDESEKIISSIQYSVNGLNINYEKVFSTSD